MIKVSVSADDINVPCTPLFFENNITLKVIHFPFKITEKLNKIYIGNITIHLHRGAVNSVSAEKQLRMALVYMICLYSCTLNNAH